MTRHVYNADILHIGYPKAASTFLRKYLSAHPQVDVVHQQAADVLYQPKRIFAVVAKPHRNKLLVSSDESIAESVCVTGDAAAWSKNLYTPGAFNLVRHDIILDPDEAARRLHALFPQAKILMVIRGQVDWFESLYKYTVGQLPHRQRAFADYWITPQGIAMRAAAHHFATIRAWQRCFADVLVLRYEDLATSSARLCNWLGIEHVPLPSQRENESHATLATLHRYLPISALPLGVKSALRPLVKLLPGRRRSLLNEQEKIMIGEHYAESNEITEELLRPQPPGKLNGKPMLELMPYGRPPETLLR